MLGVGEWIELLLKDDKPVVKTAALTRMNNSNSRASRLQMASGLLGDADAQITVYSDNEVVIQLQAEVDGELVPVDGVSVNTRDALNPDSQWDEKKSVNGAVLVPINELTADEYDVFHLGVEINPYDQGYRNIVFEDLDIERGTVYTCLLTPIESVRANPDFASNQEFDEYINQLLKRSKFSIPVDVRPTDALLTLSTCLDDDRVVVVARRMRPDESRDELISAVETA